MRKTRDRRPAERATRQRRWIGPAIAIVTVGLLWGVPEVITRLVDPPLRQYRALYFGSDPNSPRLFMTDPRLHWRLRPDVDLTFLGTRVQTDAAGFRRTEATSGRHTVLCLGDSTTFGWLVEGEQTFAAELQGLLAGRTGASDWRVLNGGVPGYTSFQVRQLAEKLVPDVRPEVLVVCVGNNEAAPAAESDRHLDEARWLAAPLERAMSVSHFATWLQERFVPVTPPPTGTAPSDRATRRVSRAEFADNVRAIVDVGRRHGARVIVLSPPVNLFAPPHSIPTLPDSAAIVTWCEAITARIDAGDAAGALPEIDARLATDARAFYARWLRGYALVQLGDLQRGTAELERALEDDTLSDRCPLSYRDALAGVMSGEDASFIDTNDLFRSRSHGVLDAMFADHCHPNSSGHGMIAAALAGLIPGGRR